MPKRKRRTIDHTIQVALSPQIRMAPNKPGNEMFFVWNWFSPEVKLPDEVTIHLVYFLTGLSPKTWLKMAENFCIKTYLFIDTLHQFIKMV